MSFAHDPGLYIHIPFCKCKCRYCDFYSIASPDLIPAYLTALEQEAALYRDVFPAGDSLYLGGGTPSLLDGGQLTGAMACLRRHFAFSPASEITLEANPDDVSGEKLRLWQDLGINRLSLGVQSLDDEELSLLGRRHTARQAVQALELARAAGYDHLGLDLIYGLPGQGEEDWLRILQQAVNWRPEHLSCYQLTVEPGTPLAAAVAQGRTTPADEETQRALFLLTSQFLREQGYLHYEVANFARGEPYLCRHNRKYWQHTPYLGLGPAAHSFDGARRWWNHRGVEEYCRALAGGVAPMAGSETLSPAQLRLEALYLGFRTREGVALAALREHPGWERILKELAHEGLVTMDVSRVRPTLHGFLVADSLPLLFAP